MTKVYGIYGKTTVEINLPVGRATLPLAFTRGCLDRKNYRPASYITNKKMERAELLLITTDIPVKQIAHDLGYNDLSYFIRIFKKHTGITPQQYRKS